ncbi:AAA family ATPase [Candidatus Babeliales bacterium]|nr:AAA family ATPase [Candidatus Babeliales bacterium]MBP9843490.1 AAA family ATPase [Candidatus Babeliales bacterium]
MIVTIGAIKGGCGKSLISTNLTVLRSQAGKKVLLVDGDEQGTAGDWSDHRTSLGINTPWTTIRLRANAVRTEILKLKENYDDIIIDCGGRDTSSLRAALTVSDIFLVPFQPKSFDIWTATKVAQLVEEVSILNPNLKTYTFINCAISRGSDNDDAKKILEQIPGLMLLPQTIGMRKSFSNATSEGLGVSEIKTDKKATEEIKALCIAIFEGQQMSILHHQTMKSQVSNALFS